MTDATNKEYTMIQEINNELAKKVEDYENKVHEFKDAIQR